MLRAYIESVIGEPVDASLAIVGRELFLRGQKHLFCIVEQE